MTETPPQRVGRGRVWLVLIAIAVAWLFTPARVVLDAAWEVVTANWFWTIATFAFAGYLLIRVTIRVVLAARRAARVARVTRDRAVEHRDERRYRRVAREAFGGTLDDIRRLPEARRGH